MNFFITLLSAGLQQLKLDQLWPDHLMLQAP